MRESKHEKLSRMGRFLHVVKDRFFFVKTQGCLCWQGRRSLHNDACDSEQGSINSESSSEIKTEVQEIESIVKLNATNVDLEIDDEAENLEIAGNLKNSEFSVIGETLKNSEISVIGETLENSEKSDKSENATTSKNIRALKRRRSKIPHRPLLSINLWSIIKNSIGKDLSKIPVPVNFSEPLSMLQRLTEDFEYSSILDHAAKLTNSKMQMAFVAAFTVSAYASTEVRTGKPFNPLLGETYECDRSDDLGWKCFNEQVSHHPPTAAQHCESNLWTCWQQFTMASKFRGNYLEITPLGIAHLTFKNSGNHYTWRKVNTVVHNLIIGRLWVDQEGEMIITNHQTGDICKLNYVPTNFFRSDTKRVSGSIYDDRNPNPKWILNGKWNERMEGFEVRGNDKSDLKPPIVLWKKNNTTPVDFEKFYNFSSFACALNEPEENVAPTDSRRRPDQRLTEIGEWEEANNEKFRLEEKQRKARREREASNSGCSSRGSAENFSEEGYAPAWFHMVLDSITHKQIYQFKGDYWECKELKDWSRCPDIF